MKLWKHTIQVYMHSVGKGSNAGSVESITKVQYGVDWPAQKMSPVPVDVTQIRLIANNIKQW